MSCRSANMYRRWCGLLLAAILPAVLAADDVTITILETADVHGRLVNWDYGAARPADLGLAVVASIVRAERVADPDLLLLDGGDTLQGTPLVDYFQTRQAERVNPMAMAMNALRYDAMTIGNHDYDYGAEALAKFIREAQFPVLSANVRGSDGREVYAPFTIRDVKGVRVGILGLTTVGVPAWAAPDQIKGLRFDDAVKVARTLVPRLRAEGVTVIVALVHTGTHVEPAEQQGGAGWETDYHTWVDRGYAQVPDRNFVIPLCEQVPEVDVVLAAHAHATIPRAMIGGVLVVEPSLHGRGVAKVTLTVGPDGAVKAKRGEFLASAGRLPDPAFLKLVQPYQEATLASLQAPLGAAAGPFPGGPGARRRDGPLADFLNAVQLQMAAAGGFAADVASVAVFTDQPGFSAGPITPADVHRVYPYENTLVVLEITGDALRQALEQDARYWLTYDPQHPPPGGSAGLVAPTARPYNWDLYTGINYRLDLTREPGQRVVELKFRGADVTPEQRLRLALNSHRAAGGGGYPMFRDAKRLYESPGTIRDAIGAFIAEHKTIKPDDYFVENWWLLPADLPE